MDTRDIKGHLTQLKSYAISVLGYDKVTAKCKIEINEYEITVDCDDTFQQKGDYSSRIAQEIVIESFDWETPLDIAVADVYDRLKKVMKREERELRYGLNLIGKSLEAGADYRTHAGLEFVASMKQEQEKTMLMLPDRTGHSSQAQVEDEPELYPHSHEERLVPRPEPAELDDEIPF